jgi:hypothetical protein
VTIQDYVEQVIAQMGESWLPRIYRERILTMRTRAFHFEDLKRNGRVEIQHTLLGVELKVSNRRLFCPDLPTARYLSIFARAGCLNVAVPYDITKISQLADELESSWHRMLLVAEHNASGRPDRFKARIRGLIIAKLRQEVSDAGPGSRVPEFKQTTKQRGESPA